MSTTLETDATRGIGHPNIMLQKDYKGDAKWYAVVETMVPIPDPDLPKVQEWLGMPNSGGIELAGYLVGKVPAQKLGKGKGTRNDAKHMVAAALGFEIDPKTGRVTK